MFEVQWNHLDESWEVTVTEPERWTLTMNVEESERWSLADAVIGARSILIGYSLRRDQPGLTPEWREKFTALPLAVELACCEFRAVED